MTLPDAIEYAAAQLPEGWTITLHTENGAAWVDMTDPINATHRPRHTDEPLADQIRELVDHARA